MLFLQSDTVVNVGWNELSGWIDHAHFPQKKCIFLYAYVKAQGTFLHHFPRFFLKTKRFFFLFCHHLCLTQDFLVLLLSVEPDKKQLIQTNRALQAQPKASSSESNFTVAFFLYKRSRMASRCMIETSGFGSLMSAKRKTQANLIFDIQKLMVIQEKNLSAKQGCDWPALIINLEQLRECLVWIFNCGCHEWQRNLKPILCRIDLTDSEWWVLKF